jgi:uncharacterized HAD superfamily protein/hypoxanthine phosphoribosyltransferase
MQYRSVADLNDTIYRNAPRLPKDVDLVVGIPRSGLLAATLISLTLNLPLADLDGFVAGRLLATGRTRRREGWGPDAGEFKNVLIVDDSINSGKSIEAARARIQASGYAGKVTFCAVYGLEVNQSGADLILEVVNQPRFFQWNLMHHPWLKHACLDIDGVLCADPTADENDDGERYHRFLTTASPLHVPSQTIGWLVTSRLEKYRERTEQWLANQGIRYDNLIMLDAASKSERQRLNAHGSFKADAYRSVNAILFVESDLAQAKTIAKSAGKPVLCVEAQQVFYPDAWSPLAMAQSLATLPTRFKVAPPRLLVKARRALRPIRRAMKLRPRHKVASA